MNKQVPIIITGSSRGLGQEIARKWCLTSKDNENNVYYGLSRWNDLNVTNYDEIIKYVSALNNPVPVALVNNAGICKLGNIVDMNIDDLVKQFDVNYFGLVNTTKAYIQLCLKHGVKGKIINIASTAGLSARAGRSGYSSSKAAVINFSLSLSQELSEYGMKVYTICPGAFESDMRRKIAPEDDFENMLKPHEISEFIIDIINNGKFLDNQIITIRS